MSLYYRNLKRIGICMILVSAVNLMIELLGRWYLNSIESTLASRIPLPWGIWVKNLLGAAAGLIALFFYQRRRHYRIGTYILAFLCIAGAAFTILSTPGSIGKKTNAIVDITILMMVLLTYTFSQTDRDLKQWERVQTRDSITLDLMLKNPDDFFDPIQAGPKMAVNEEYASVVNRYLSAARNPGPLQINLLCPGPVSEPIQDMMREVFRMHYEAEEGRISAMLEKLYHRIMILVAVSILTIGIIRQFSLVSEDMTVWEIIGNFAAFGLWQIGYTHYDRTEGYHDLLLVHIAKYAEINFIGK